MSTEYDGFGITEQDREKLSLILQTRNQHADKSTYNPDYPTRPELEDHTVELTGNRQRKAHLPDPESSSPRAWCVGKPGGIDPDQVRYEWKTRRVGVAREWREPCSVCFPEGYPDE